MAGIVMAIFLPQGWVPGVLTEACLLAALVLFGIQELLLGYFTDPEHWLMRLAVHPFAGAVGNTFAGLAPGFQPRRMGERPD
jgi:hypothetical protein